MKKKLLMPIAALMLLAGCDYNEENFKGLEEATQPTNVFNKELTMLNVDYAVLAANKANIAIAKAAGVSKDLENVKTNLYLSEKIPGSTYFPAFLADKYYTADKGSSVKVTFNYKEPMSALLAEYASVNYLKLTDDDYELVYGSNAFAPYFNAKNEGSLTKVLSERYKDAVKGTAVFAEYRLGEGQLDNPSMWQNFEALPTGNLKTLSGWFISSTGGTDWKVNAFDENQYVQYSANGTKGECVAWMVTPSITVKANDQLAFDLAVGYYNAKCLSVLISENFDGSDVAKATWTDVTASFAIPTTPTSGYGAWASAGKLALDAYAGKKISVAFKYVGDGANKKTTTYQIDNIMIGSAIPANSFSTPKYVVKVFDGKSWKNQNAKVLVPTFAEYGEMGQTKRYFTADVPAVDYLPTYLSKMVAYPLNGDVRVVVYRFFSSNTVKAYSDEYVYSTEKGRWELNTRIVQVTEQYVLGDDKWNFDPSTTVTLKKGDAFTKDFLQKVVDGVKASKGDAYIDRGNTEYYYGCSAYYGNVELDPKYWRAMPMYADKTDAEITATIKEHAEEGGMFVEALKYYYPDANLVEGVEVIYTVNFDVHKVSGPGVYTIQYLVTGKGTFEYIKDSYKEVQ